MSNVDELIQCAEKLKGIAFGFIVKVADSIQKNEKGVEENRNSIEEIRKRLETLSVGKKETDTTDSEDVQLEKGSQLDMSKANISEIKLCLYKDSIVLKNHTGLKIYNIENIDFHTKIGVEKRVYRTLKTFVENGGTVRTETFLGRYAGVVSVHNALRHFNRALQKILGIKECVFAEKLGNLYVLKFKTEDRMNESIKTRRVGRVFSQKI